MHCPSCKSTDTFITEFFAADDPSRQVWECRDCTLQYLKPVDNLREFYDKDFRALEELVIDRYWRQRYIAHWSYRSFTNAMGNKGGKVLDIGCSAGGFLSLIEHQYECYGLEWNAEDATFVRDMGQVPCSQDSITECFPDVTFDAIVARQVLEHQIAPHQFLEDCLSRLTPKGVLFMEMPNNDWPYKGGAHSGWYGKAHCLYWNTQSLEMFFNNHLEQGDYSLLDISKWAYRSHLIAADMPDMLRVVMRRA